MSGPEAKRGAKPQGPSKVLHVRGLPPFTNEAELIAVCQPFGVVQRVLVLNAKDQAFVQMESVDAATALLSHHDVRPAYIRGKPIYFQYSGRSEVKAPALGAGSGSGRGGGDDSQATPNNILLVSILNARVPVTIENIQQIFKPYADPLKIVTFVKGDILKALVQLPSVEAAVTAKLRLEGKDMFQGCCHLRIGYSKLKDLVVKQNSPRMRDFTSSPSWGLQHQQPYLFSGPYGPAPAAVVPFPEQGSVVIVSNLNPEKMTVDKLFMLFGVYGDVIRVKIMYTKRDTALIQFANAQQAHLAQAHLNRLNLYGKEMSVNISKHSEIQMPRGEQDPSNTLTKDFSSSPIHRFRDRLNRLQTIFPPSKVLHVSNLYDGCTEEELRKLFGQDQRGQPVVQFFKRDRKMAYVKMDSTQDAAHALMKLHNYKLGGKYMRISFSSRDRIDSAGD